MNTNQSAVISTNPFASETGKKVFQFIDFVFNYAGDNDFYKLSEVLQDDFRHHVKTGDFGRCKPEVQETLLREYENLRYFAEEADRLKAGVTGEDYMKWINEFRIDE